jgi:hypothetical protein
MSCEVWETRVLDHLKGVNKRGEALKLSQFFARALSDLEHESKNYES